MNVPEEIKNFLCEEITEPRQFDIGFENFEFPKAEQIIDYQMGYRWEGGSGKRLAGWPDNWVVIGHSNADPLIYDTLSGSVNFARHGAGSWIANRLFSDLQMMLECIQELSKIITAAGDNLFDEDFNILSKHVNSMQSLLVDTYGVDVGSKIIEAFEIKDWSV
tara:strand:+ start:1664 stop:2152 length:489 start_codon:yes stop_codon:yes gene_type:complete